MILEKQKKETTSNVLLSINITIKRFQNAYEKKAVFNWMKKKKAFHKSGENDFYF